MIALKLALADVLINDAANCFQASAYILTTESKVVDGLAGMVCPGRESENWGIAEQDGKAGDPRSWQQYEESA